MKSCDRIIILLVALLWTAFPMIGVLWGEERDLKTDTAEAVDAVLVLDSSGSMLLSDPLRLRYEGARLFLQFLKPGDRLAVVSFAEQASVIRELAPFDATQLDGVSAQLGQIQSTGQYTNLMLGIEAAADLLHKNANKSAKPLIVLLSDGKMDPSPESGTPEALTDKMMNEILPELKAQGMRVYTLAFSEEADKPLLSQIAASTDGVQWFTPSADKIHESFADLFLAVKKPQVVPISAKGFVIDGDVQEATFYVNRENDADVYLRSPSGTEIRSTTSDTNIKWFHGQKFDVITINKPDIGSWQIFGISPNEGFATILTNLKLVSDWPSNIESGSEALLQARLYEDKKPISLPEMTGASRFAFQITPTDRVAEPIVREFLVDDGTKGDKIANDGIFSFEVKLDDPGEYKLRILAKAPTFERQQQIPFRVKPPLISLSIRSGEGEGEGSAHGESEAGSEHGEGDKHGHEGGHEEHSAHNEPESSESKKSEEETGDEKSIIAITLSEEALTFRNLQVKLMVVDINRQRYTIAPKRGHDALEYEIPAAALPADGTYSLQGVLTADDKQKKTIKQESRILKFTRSSSGEGAPTVMVKVVEEKKEEEQSTFPITDLIIVTVVNLLSVGVAFMLIKRAKSGASEATPIPPIPEAIFQGITVLEQKLTMTEVDLADPVFAEGGSSEQASPQVVAPSSEAAGEGEAAAPVEAAEEEPAESPAEGDEPPQEQEESAS